MIKRVSRASGDVFQVYGRRGNRKVYVGTFDTKKLAAAADEDFRVVQRKIEAGELPKNFDEKRTFEIAIDAWIAMLKSSKSRSLTGYSMRARLYLKPYFGHRPVAHIQKEEIGRFRDAMLETPASDSTNTVIGALSSAFTWFVEQNYVASNPCFGVKRPKRVPKIFPWLESSEAITRVLSNCNGRCRWAVALLIGTGMRIDELLFMQWDDVNFDHRLLTVCRGKQGVPKSGRHRRLPIFDSIMPVLREMKLARGDARLLFPGEVKGKPLTPPSIRDPFKIAAAKSGIDKRIRLHDLRHTFASHFLLDGGDIFKLSKLLGHSSVAITERTYAHLRKDAFEADYGRVKFAMPTDAKVIQFQPTRTYAKEDKRETR